MVIKSRINYSPNRLSFCLIIIIILLMQLHLFGQKERSYGSVGEIKEEWQDYTSFQKEELLSFGDFLFEEEYYERAILAYFKFIFLFPDDDLLPIVYYLIARSYEETNNIGLAIEYYEHVLSESDPNASEYTATVYRMTYLDLRTGDYESVIEKTINTEDPYLLTFRGYAYFSQLKWDDARESFQQARVRFNDGYYEKDLMALIDACDNVSALKLKSKFLAGLSGILPGGGRIYLQDWIPFSGAFITTIGLGLQITSSASNSIPILIQTITFAGYYVMTIWGSLSDVDYINHQKVLKYTEYIKVRRGPELFLDFPEPEYLTF